jgi:hypothetical protein
MRTCIKMLSRAPKIDGFGHGPGVLADWDRTTTCNAPFASDSIPSIILALSLNKKKSSNPSHTWTSKVPFDCATQNKSSPSMNFGD